MRWTWRHTLGAAAVIGLGLAAPFVGPRVVGALRPALYTLVSGNNQTVQVSLPIPQTLVVHVTDSAGRNVVGDTIVFHVTAGAGTLASDSVQLTATGGLATLPDSSWTLGSSAGANTVTALAKTLFGPATNPLTFTAVGTAAAGGPPIADNAGIDGLGNSPNLPAWSSPTVEIDRPFHSTSDGQAGWSDTATLNADPHVTFGTSTTAPTADHHFERVQYYNGLLGGNDPVHLSGSPAFAAAHTRVYWALYFAVDSQFVPHSSGVNKLGFINSTQLGPCCIPSMSGATWIPTGGATGPRIQVRFQGTAAGAFNEDTTTTPGKWQPGQWHLYEIALVMNTPGTANGTLDFWLDNHHVGTYSNLLLVAAAQSTQWANYTLEFTWGGTGGTLGSDHYLYLNHLKVVTAP